MRPVIVCGGYGTRLWPLSRHAWPKQFADLGFEHSLFQQTLLRLVDHPLLQQDAQSHQSPSNLAPLIVANEQHRFLLLHQLEQIGMTAADIILEPCGRNTAAAICLAALWQEEKNEAGIPMLVLPADHIIENTPAFHQAISDADALANSDYLATFGIHPEYAETGYGYIQAGAGIEHGHRIAAFTEKPDAETARRYIDSGGYYWNSGMFAFTAENYLQELSRHKPDMLGMCRAAWRHKNRKWEFIHPDEEAFSYVEDISVDYAVMEPTDSAAMVSLNAGWSDLGSWKSVLTHQGATLPSDQLVLGHNSRGCHVKSTTGKTIGLVGVDDLLVVDTADALLIAASESSQDVGAIVQQLRQQRPELITQHNTTFRAWGWHKVLTRTDQCQVNQMQINPSSHLSFRKHQYHSVHWTVISGTAEVYYQDTKMILTAHQSHFIPAGMAYRLVNASDSDSLEIIELQTGAIRDFDNDLVRLKDEHQDHE